MGARVTAHDHYAEGPRCTGFQHTWKPSIVPTPRHRVASRVVVVYGPRPPLPPLRAFGRRIIPYHTLPALTHRDYWGKGEGTWILQVPKPYAPPWPSTMAWSARMNARRASGPRDT